MGCLRKSYRLRDGTETVMGEYTLWGLIQMQIYPRKEDWGWQSEVWRQHQHDYGAPGHRLRLIRERKCRAIPPSHRDNWLPFS